MKRSNPERLERLRAKQFGPQAELCRRSPCHVCGAPPPSDPHHVVTRERGGLDEHTVPLCRAHHEEWHDAGGRAFDRRHGVDLLALALELKIQVSS